MNVPNEIRVFFLIFVAIVPALSAPPNWYVQMRNNFLKEEQDMRVGSDLVLNDHEEIVNRFMMAMKEEEIHNATYTFQPYLASGHFFQTKNDIEATTIFKVIKKMPKGGALHLHDASVVNLEWVIKNMTYLPHLYTRNATEDQARMLKFSNIHPGNEWESLEAMRRVQGADTVDKMLMDEWSIWTPDPYNTYKSPNVIWAKFGAYFDTIVGLRTNTDLALMYLNEAMNEFHEDNVQYFELRDGNLWDENGNYITEDYMRVAGPAIKAFQDQHPDFIGMKFILGGYRSYNNSQAQESVDVALDVMQKYPDLAKGYDLDSHEDYYHRIFYFIDQLLKDGKSVLPYFFHAGETDWTEQADLNLVDALLLNSTRIGHGFAALKHPKVMAEIKRKGTVVELNPISNQVLGLVGDLRNHPGATYLANGYSVVVSSDDHALWGASPLSHDFYMAFMAVGSTKDDIRLLKKLAMNSLQFSTMTDAEKTVAMAKWQRKWNEFIDATIAEYNLKPNPTTTPNPPDTTVHPDSAGKPSSGFNVLLAALISLFFIAYNTF